MFDYHELDEKRRRCFLLKRKNVDSSDKKVVLATPIKRPKKTSTLLKHDSQCRVSLDIIFTHALANTTSLILRPAQNPKINSPPMMETQRSSNHHWWTLFKEDRAPLWSILVWVPPGPASSPGALFTKQLKQILRFLCNLKC